MKLLFLSLLVPVLFFSAGGCATSSDLDDRYEPDRDAEDAYQNRLSKMRRQNQGF